MACGMSVRSNEAKARSGLTACRAPYWLTAGCASRCELTAATVEGGARAVAQVYAVSCYKEEMKSSGSKQP